MLTAYVEPVGIGDALPSLPLFLSEDRYIPAPLEATYQEAWAVFPTVLKEILEPTEREGVRRCRSGGRLIRRRLRPGDSAPAAP